MSALDNTSRIYVAGHRGLVGSALMRRLKHGGFNELITRSHDELDLTDARAVDQFFARERPDYVFLAAAKVGGIHANDAFPADFIRENLAIQLNVIHSAWTHGARKLVFLGSSCIYPKLAPQPLKEEYLLTGLLEPTNEPYAIAKIAGVKMCQAYRKQYGFDAICAMPTNLYGPDDNFHAENSHVIPGLIRRLSEATRTRASEVAIWGSGKPLREFLHADDLAAALLHLAKNVSQADLINIGSGDEVSILQLAESIADIVGFTGRLEFDPSKSDGAPRKLLDSSKIRSTGWAPAIALSDGLRQVISAVKAKWQSAS